MFYSRLTWDWQKLYNVTFNVFLKCHSTCAEEPHEMFSLRLWRATRQSLILSHRQRKSIFPHGSGCLLDESGLQLILDLHLLNLKLRTCSFRILTLKHILYQSWTGDWFINIDLKLAYSIFILSRKTQVPTWDKLYLLIKSSWLAFCCNKESTGRFSHLQKWHKWIYRTPNKQKNWRPLGCEWVISKWCADIYFIVFSYREPQKK